jgi:hypothetical protein
MLEDLAPRSIRQVHPDGVEVDWNQRSRPEKRKDLASAKRFRVPLGKDEEVQVAIRSQPCLREETGTRPTLDQHWIGDTKTIAGQQALELRFSEGRLSRQ